jgi:hypothetical protein
MLLQKDRASIRIRASGNGHVVDTPESGAQRFLFGVFRVNQLPESVTSKPAAQFSV